MSRFDYVVVGGGLQGGLIALAVRHFQPAATIILLEETKCPGGNHTWSFHALDVPAAAAPFVEPLVSVRWPSYLVAFPEYRREISSPYASILSDRFAAVVTTALNEPGRELRTGAEAVAIGATHVEIADGSILEGRCVIDARGPGAAVGTAGCGYQKFLGLEVETDRPWPDQIPTVMDATVPQDDGYRFTYTLPFSACRILVEDTYFSNSSRLNQQALRNRVAEQIDSRVAGNWRVIREESGVLPMPWSGVGLDSGSDGPIAGGACGGWYHPATGYSLPMAVRLATAIARERPERARFAVQALARRMRGRHRFARLLNRLLFRAVVRSERWQIFRRLYRDLSDESMARFYAMEFTAADAARIVIGWPPPLAPLGLFQRLEEMPCPSSLN